MALCASAWLAACAGPAARRDAFPSDACGLDFATRAPRFVATEYDAQLPRRGQWRDGFELADLDGDGHLDLVHGPARKGRATPAILRGDGRGGFHFWNDAHFPPLPYDYGDVAVADFNGDGVLDLAFAVHLHGVVAMINEGGGHFAPWGEGLGLRAPTESVGEAVFSSRALAGVDWNGDGRADLLAVNEGPSLFTPERAVDEGLKIFVNRDGYWQPQPLQPDVRAFGDALTFGDVDGDARPEALFGTQRGGERRLLVRSGVPAQAQAIASLPDRAAVTGVALADFDRDGRDEALLATRTPQADGFCSGLLRVGFRRDGGEDAAWAWSEASRTPLVAFASGDIDGDRRRDAIALRQDGTLLFFAGARRGLVADRSLPVPDAYRGCEAYDLALADLDDDRRLELIVSFAGDDASGETCASGGGFQAWRLDAD